MTINAFANPIVISGLSAHWLPSHPLADLKVAKGRLTVMPVELDLGMYEQVLHVFSQRRYRRRNRRVTDELPPLRQGELLIFPAFSGEHIGVLSAGGYQWTGQHFLLHDTRVHAEAGILILSSYMAPCRSCQQQIGAGDAFCRHCGTRQQSDSEQEAKKRPYHGCGICGMPLLEGETLCRRCNRPGDD